MSYTICMKKNLNDTYVEKIEVEALLAEVYTFCRTPEIAWYNAIPEARVKYQRLIFPQGIYYDFNSLSSRKLGLPFKSSTLSSDRRANQ